jgi:hypothetical protein
MLFQYLPYFDYTEQKADVTPIIISGSPRVLYDMKDFSPVIDNVSPVSRDDCKLKYCGDSYNWSVRTYAAKNSDFKITITVTRFRTHKKAQRAFDDYVLVIKKNRFDKYITQNGYSMFISSVKRLRWDFPPSPTGEYASRVIFLKNNIMVEVYETSKSKRGDYKNTFMAGLGRQLGTP